LIKDSRVWVILKCGGEGHTHATESENLGGGMKRWTYRSRELRSRELPRSELPRSVERERLESRRRELKGKAADERREMRDPPSLFVVFRAGRA
jgi:hypothetical protein